MSVTELRLRKFRQPQPPPANLGSASVGKLGEENMEQEFTNDEQMGYYYVR
jgi:hypothetical protein